MEHVPLSNKRLSLLSLAALGVVYGDIGTSPLYALRESLRYTPLNHDNILGVLSLIFWSLILIITIKYLVFILRVDNDGEGGAMALLSLLNPQKYSKKAYAFLFILGIFGASLLFSDGMITPAISVLSAVEGLTLVSPHFQGWIIPSTCFILLLLFMFQSRGTEKVGTLFGPVMIAWFVTIGTLGLLSIVKNPSVLEAVNPWYAIAIFKVYHWHAMWVLTGVFLVVTGGEALYADMSHFGRRPIRITWVSIVLPALLLSYFGQGADLLSHPEHLRNPFYLLASPDPLYPLIALSTMATIIASQAMISAVFSLAKQALTLQVLPRLNIVFTSHDLKGQVFVPDVNLLIAIGSLALVIAFKSSANLAHAYGLAVNMDMIIITFLVVVILHNQSNWSFAKVLAFSVPFLAIDFTFLSANTLKVLDNGWFPLLFAVIGTTIMLTWKRGLMLLKQASQNKKITLNEIAHRVYAENITKVPGVAVFINEPYDESKSALFRQLEFNRTIHEVTLLIDVIVEEKPIIPIDNRVHIHKQISSLYHIKLHYGFMQRVDIPNTLRVCQEMKILPFLTEQTNPVYFLEMVNAQVTDRYNHDFPKWQKRIFVTMLNNFTQNINFYHLPVHRTVMVGTYYEI